MLERDETCQLHSNSTHVVVQLKAHVDYLQVALFMAEEEVIEARALATAARVQEHTVSCLLPLIPTAGFLFSDLSGIL